MGNHIANTTNLAEEAYATFYPYDPLNGARAIFLDAITTALGEERVIGNQSAQYIHTYTHTHTHTHTPQAIALHLISHI